MRVCQDPYPYYMCANGLARCNVIKQLCALEEW